MANQDIKQGDLVLYKGGLFKVYFVHPAMNEMGDEFTVVDLGDIVVPIEEVCKADWRDITRIIKVKS